MTRLILIGLTALSSGCSDIREGIAMGIRDAAGPLLDRIETAAGQQNPIIVTAVGGVALMLLHEARKLWRKPPK